jgi:ferritin-like protein
MAKRSVRNDLHFLFLTKRIERFSIGLPDDYQDGYDNVTICSTIENNVRAKERLSVFKELPIKHKNLEVT